MTKSVRTLLGMLGVGLVLAGCQGVPGLFGPGMNQDPSLTQGGNLIGNNAASLSGQVFAPSSLVANNSAALIGNNSAALVSNNAAAYRTASVTELPVIKAHVEAMLGGDVVSKSDTDETGHYTLSSLAKDKAYLLRVTFTLDGQKFQELGIAKPFVQQSGNTVNSASTFVAAKIVKQGTPLDQVNMNRYYDTTNLVSSNQNAIDPASLTSTDQSAAAFDQLSQSNEQVANSFHDTVTPTSTTTNPTPTPTATPVTTTYAARDYFYPPSGTAKATFLTTQTTSGGGQATSVATSSYSVKVTSYTSSDATLQQTVGDITLNDTVLQVSGGLVKMGTMTDTGPVYSMSMGAPVFTTDGAVVSPFGATDTVRYQMVSASEVITVKGGTYTCVKLLETTTSGQTQTQRTFWYAKGIGLGPVKALVTTTQSTSGGTQTTTKETVLTSFQP